MARDPPGTPGMAAHAPTSLRPTRCRVPPAPADAGRWEIKAYERRSRMLTVSTW